MAGGKSTPKKDKANKKSSGQSVKAGQILVRGCDNYKAGKNVQGKGTLFALVDGKVIFSKKRNAGGKVKTYISVRPE
jgi:ribosomal protein L27